MYYSGLSSKPPHYSDEQIDFIIDCMWTMTDEETAELFAQKFNDVDINPRKISYLINYLNLEQYLSPPDSDRPWEEIKENKIQCFICGRWYKALSYHHFKLKHNMTIEEYRLKYGMNKTQPLCSLKTAEKFRKFALERIENGIFKINPNIGQERPQSYKKSRQCIVIKTESGLQSKAGKSKKKPATFRVDKRVKKLIDKLKSKNMSFEKIVEELKNRLNCNISIISVKRLYYGKRNNFKI